MNAVVLNCNERNYTVRTSRIPKCETGFFVGELSRHRDEKQEFQRKKGNILAALGTAPAKIELDLKGR